jgi:benzoyl-CoA reductase/2-hydroxyglutaryl-CoA dehydratase subunit BcrC/BadD/HgdB
MTSLPGLVKRSYDLIKTIERLENYTPMEVEGLYRIVGKDLGQSAKALLDERHDGAGLHFMRVIARHIAEAVEAKEDGKKVILIPFNFPPELIHAFENAVPLTTEVISTIGVTTLEGQGEPYWDYAMSLGIPDYVCSANTIELGSALMSVETLELAPDIIISGAPGSCDANSKIHEFVAEYLDIPELTIDKTGSGKRDYELYRKLFLNMVKELEEFVGEDIDEDKIIEVMERANECTELYWELHELKKHSPCPVPNMFTLFTYGTRFTMWGRDEAISMFEKLVDVAEKRLKRGEYPAEKEIARSLWVYTGYYIDLYDLWIWMENNGITYLTDILNSGGFPQIYEVFTKEDALEAIIRTSWNYGMTKQMGAENMGLKWTEDFIFLAEDLNANCAIYCGHHACKQSQAVFRILRDGMSSRGIPVLRLDGDCWNKRITPVSVLQEMILDFVQNVVTKRRRRRRR